MSLAGLYLLLDRIERQALLPGDWTVCGALVLQLITRTEARQQRMLAKLAAAEARPSTTVIDAQATRVVPPGDAAPIAPLPAGDAPGNEGPQTQSPAPNAKKKGKGH